MDAWIDVGGTFTDCYLLDSKGARSAIKVLSSGLVPVSVRSIDGARIQCAQLADDCDGFWTGGQFRCLDQAGQCIQTAQVIAFDSSAQELVLDQELSDGKHAAFFELAAEIEAPVLAVRRLARCALSEPLPPVQVRLGTTRGTNALLTRRGAPTALAITAPMEDLLRIGDQTRANLFQLGIPPREVLASEILGIYERLDATGQVLLPLDEAQAIEQLKRGRSAGNTSLAICLMHSYLNPRHELRLESLAYAAGFQHVSRSSQLAPLIEIIARAQTTLVDAYLSPVINGYLAMLVEQFGGLDRVQLHVMTSSGGLVDWRNYSGKDSILSGPAGGAVALAAIGQAMQCVSVESDQPRATTRAACVLGLDMGGTSTDVCRVGASFDLQYESTKAGVRILTPTLPIETVASGGGSICWFDGVSLRVGPRSAGALPGPACYGRSGPLTITDLNVFLGRLPACQFPFPLDVAVIGERLQEIFQQIQQAELGIRSIEHLAEGFRRIANQQMAEAVRSITISQGVDPRDHSLLGFGGAAGQHICEIADLLGINSVIDSAEAGMLSALGMGLAALRKDATVPIYTLIGDCDWPKIEKLASTAEQDLIGQLAQETAVQATRFNLGRKLELRYRGTDVSLVIAWCGPSEIAANFHAEHQTKFGYQRTSTAIELVSVRMAVQLGSTHRLSPVAKIANPNCEPAFENRIACWHDQRWSNIPIIRRSRLVPGQCLAGPMVVMNQGSTLAVASGWISEVLSDGTLHLTRGKLAEPTRASLGTHFGATNDRGAAAGNLSIDPIQREVYAQRLMAIATQMGLVLQKTAISVNVKQRRDFSCAVFDAAGRLLANAPHVPVHLGAMGQTVRSIIGDFPNMLAGDVFVTNDPYRGGSHLPDVTVVTPVFSRDGRVAMFTASRAHHADIGGMSPGSMSITSTRLGEEGVIIPPMYLIRAGDDRTDQLRYHLKSATWPPRNIDENLADLAAQQAANARGARLIEDLATMFGWGSLEKYNESILQIAAQRVARWIDSAPRATCLFVDHLDDGTAIAAKIEFPEPGRARIDFSGTGETSSTNFNANPSIVTAAVMYVFRCLIDDDLPLNEGVMRVIELVIPRGILHPHALADAQFSPAVAAGNVETSQRIVDVLLGALQVAAASQGTMNNLLFGNAKFGFYETICGGAGAIEGLDGASGVHTHMTNTRLTDPEILESRYPVRLERFQLRRHSGGQGRWRGGEGVIRAMRFLEPVTLSLLTSRRGDFAPYGLAGGESGTVGKNLLRRADGTVEQLPGCCQIQLDVGDVLELHTPGGGGYGRK